MHPRVTLAQPYHLSAMRPPPPTTPHHLSPLCFRPELEVKEENEGRRAETEGRGGGPVTRAAPAGRSGAAPPVIIRVTAARARLCVACTRRDVLPREKSEHLSVPPCRQQPPTSLSNSIQVVTRSPNSYFLSLVDSRTPALNSSALLFLLCSLAPVCSGPLLQRGLKKGIEMSYLNRSQFYVNALLMH